MPRGSDMGWLWLLNVVFDVPTMIYVYGVYHHFWHLKDTDYKRIT